MFEDDEKLAKIMSDHGNLKENLEIRPISGAVQSQKLVTVEVTVVPKNELILKESPILKCHLVDTNKEVAVIAEIPLTVSLIAYYTRFRLNPFPTIDFGSIGVCTEKTVYFNIENTGKFPLHYLIYVQPDRHPSVIYMSNVRKENLIKKGNLADRVGNIHSKKDKKSTRSDKTAGKGDSELRTLRIGPMTITKTEGDVDVDQTDTVAINCYPEFVGSQEEHITVLVADSIPEDRNGKTLTLSVDSRIPSLDFQDLDTMFQENYLIDHLEDFDCPKEIGACTIFARQEKCLYFRHVCVLTTHTTRFKLINRNVISADVEVLFLENSLTPKTDKSDTFIVEPQRDRIPSMSYKTFMVSFAPTIIETFSGVIEVTVNLPPHLEDEKFIIKLVGESCVPEVAIIEPTRGKREKVVLSFDRTLLFESNTKEFALENTGFIPSKVIVDIFIDPNFVFAISTCSDTLHMLQILDGECAEPNDRCTVIRLMPGNVARFGVKFSPQEIGKHEGEIRFFIVDNPYENLSISLVGEAYVESVVLDGLKLVDNKQKVVNGTRDNSYKARKMSSKQSSLISASTTSVLTVSLIYDLDYGACFINKMYKKTFKIANKSTNRWSRFQWNPHPDVVFVPSIGHLKYLTCKEITATFLVAEPTNHTNTCIDCVVCEIHLADPSNEIAWDDRQTEVRWEEMDPGFRIREMDDKKLARKIVEATAEPINEIVHGTTKCIQVLLNATAAFSKYSCAVQEIHFKDTLMFQTREYTFALSNPGVVNTTYAWDISMDEQYPKKLMVRSPNATSWPRSEEEVRSRPTSKSLKGIFSFTRELSRGISEKDEKSDGDTERSKLYRLEPHVAYDTLEVKPSSSSCNLSDLFSSVAGLTGRSTDSWLESNNFPFTITPAEGSLLPQQSVECTLKFSPMDVFLYKAYLTCKIENVDPELPTLIIPIVARSLLPYCHFEVQESDYISSGRRDAKLPGPVGSEIEDSTLWENIRVIEFKVVGVGETHVKKFHMINPTTEDYHFSWRNRTIRTEGELSNFHCMVSEGIAERGKRTDLAFTFLAEDVGVYESFWLFSIERYNLKSLFLIVGVVTEPSVHCLTLHLKMKPTILGINVRETIRILNKEEFPIPFRILEESLYSEGKYQYLNVTPMTGILAPNNEQILWVEYHPTRVGEFHYSMQCLVKMMKKPINIFVTTTSYNIAPSISYIDTKGQNVKVQEDKENIIDFGKLMTKSSIAVNLDIRNSGEVAFYYSWDLGMTPEIISRNTYSVTMSQRQGYVTKESRSTCYLTLTAFQKTMIKEHSMTLKITGGPIYRFILKALVSKPAVEFSFRRYDFGPCYIQENNPIAYQTELRLTNSDDTAFIIECKFEEKPHMSVGLEAISEALAAHSSITVPIIFRPLKEVKYREYLSFKIDSSMERRITLTGEGITYKVRLVNPREKLIDLGNIPVNKTVIKKIQVVNEARAPIELKFGLMKSLTGYQDYRDRIRGCEETSTEEEAKKDLARASILETKRSWTNDMTLQTGEPDLTEVLEIQPSTKVVLEPNKRINVAVKFRPSYRIRPFVSKVALETSSTILPLFVLRGSCVGAEFRLNRAYVSFGTIVEGCSSETAIMLLNIGDVGSRFKWNISKLPRDFKIFPISGYSSPGMDTNFVVKFQPSEQHNLIEGEASIVIEKYGSLNVKITGGCCKLPEPIETLFFTSIVRDKQTKYVTIMNDTNLPWKLKPEAIGDCFSTEETLHVPPKTTISCRVTYAPVVMNTESTPHKGMLLFRFPDERVPMLYSLHGLSLPPKVLDKIQRQFPAKTKYTESLPVFNWLGRKQQFECKIGLLNGNGVHSKQKIPLYSFTGNNKIDVPPNSQRDYRGTFFSYEESNFRFKITFTNQEGEYQFYEIEYDVTKPEIMESIKLITTVRFPTCHSLKLENPLSDSAITYIAHCQNPYISIRGVPKVVGALSHEYINVRYFPMLPTNETVVMLDVNCQELGYFPYELRLKAVPSLPEKVTRVNAMLGSATAFSLSVRNYVKQNVQFAININNDSFLCKDKLIEVPGSTDGSINVTYEPFEIENVTATLTASSNIAGEYTFPIIGTYSLPKPLGPYIVKPKMPASIPFKNVFKETKTFEFIFDIPKVFATETSSATIRHKQSIVINVSIHNENQEGEFREENYPVTGKLMVFCKDPKLSHINWIYYLKGIFD